MIRLFIRRYVSTSNWLMKDLPPFVRSLTSPRCGEGGRDGEGVDREREGDKGRGGGGGGIVDWVREGDRGGLKPESLVHALSFLFVHKQHLCPPPTGGISSGSCSGAIQANSQQHSDTHRTSVMRRDKRGTPLNPSP